MLRAPRSIAMLVAWALAAASGPVRAQDVPKGLPIIRDSEIEQLLRDYTQPILRAAGLAQQHIHVVIINDRSFNAFVIDAKHIFVNAGALMQAKSPNQIIGVFAHETGHIAGGHLSKMRSELANAQTAMILGMLLGVGAVAAGARGGNVGGNPGIALLAPQSMIQHSLLAYQRQQEEQADRAGVKFLTATGQSTKGMYDTFKRFADESLFAAQQTDPYLQSHPMPAERMAALEEIAKTSPYWNKPDSPELQLRHDMMRAKLYGFMDRPDTVLRRYPPSDTSLPARYARAISTFRHGDMRTAIAEIESLIQTQPNNPYFYEIKGQALLEAGRPAEAIAPLRRALSTAPNPALIQVMLGQALIASGQNGAIDEAIGNLRNAAANDPDISDAYEYLAMAYGRKGNLADADLASAQAAFARGDWKTARQLATRAKTRFPVGAPGWVKADDIASYKPPNPRATQ
ncbi:MAG TPA: M48 family metalloprotease [Xanthobacteraceae bacterium]|nr:M48 family metalloprotease [Xanthobacteraceae bacterium]